MKKILILLMILLAACQKLPTKSDRAFSVVNVGTTANDGTGDPLRTAFQKVNANFLAQADINQQVRDSLANIYTEAQTQALISDTITARIAAGVDLETFVDGKLDTYVGSGGAVGMYELKGIVGTTSGFPEDGDSIIVHSGFVDHPHLQIYRDGVMQWYNEGLANNTAVKNAAFVFDNETGTIICAPTFSDGELVTVHAFDPIVWTQLVPEGSGGGSSLLTGLLASWSLDETSGTTANDNVGSNDGTISGGVVNRTGKFGKAIQHDSQTDYVEVPNSSSYNPGDSLTISLWFKLTSLPSSGTKNYFLIRKYYTSAQPWSFEVFINYNGDYIAFYMYNNSNTYFAAETAEDAVVADTWYNLICTVGAGTTPAIYLNNSDVTNYTDGGNFSGTFRWDTSELYIGNANYDGTSAVQGYIDEVNLFSRIVSSGERASLQTKYYPFN